MTDEQSTERPAATIRLAVKARFRMPWWMRQAARGGRLGRVSPRRLRQLVQFRVAGV